MAPDPLIGQLVDGRWKILSQLGAGGMGVVYRAERIKIFKLVAIKFLDERCAQSPEMVARFEREARAISRLQHRHVVSILDFGVHEKRPYIVMEYLAGKPLNKVTLPPARAVAVVCQMLEALRHAHKAGVVHRDLKPENVMLVETTGTEDYVKILDFGLARIISLDEPTISQPQRVAGTPGYMSPDQIKGERIDHRTDIYSTGVLLYALCVGHKPFEARDDLDVLRMHLNAPPVPPRKAAPDRNLSPALEKVILRALEKDRDRRFFSAEEMVNALKATPEGGGVAAGRRWGWAVALLVLIGMGVAGGIYLPPLLKQPPPAPTPPLPPPPVIVPTLEPTPSPSPAMVDAAVVAVPDMATPPQPDMAAMTTAQKIEALLESEQLEDAERLLLAQAILEPRGGWVHLDLGELYFRRIWRRDTLREWELGLQMDPSLRRDPRLQRRLCATLAAGWKGAGEHFIVTHVGKDALPAMLECIRETDDAEKLRGAVRVLERVGLRSKIDRAIVTGRLESLTQRR